MLYPQTPLNLTHVANQLPNRFRPPWGRVDDRHAWGGDFRVDYKVFSGTPPSRKPMGRRSVGAQVYDFLDQPAEVVVLFPRGSTSYSWTRPAASRPK